MKTVIFVIPDLRCGGVEKSLISLLSCIERDKYNIDLLLFRKNGVLLPLVPEWVKIITVGSNISILMHIKEGISSLVLTLGLKKLFKYLRKIYYNFEKEKPLFSKDRRNNLLSYDIAIAYADGIATSYTAQKINAGKKIAFVHTDFLKAGYNISSEAKNYARFDRIFCVSAEATEQFSRAFPEFANKTSTFYNLISSTEINTMAKKSVGFTDRFKGIRILTVGRITYEKGYDLTVPVLSRLLKEGYNVKWYVIGDGNMRRNIKKMIRRYNLKDNYILLGPKDNPYPYIAECGIYVQPSRFEGYSLSVAEARALNRPIVATEFTGAREQLIHGKTGIITDISEDGIYTGIKQLLDDIDLRKRLEYNLSLQDVDTTAEIYKLYEVIGD